MINIIYIYILKIKDAEISYSTTILHEAAERFHRYNAAELEKLSHVVRFGIPGEKKLTVEEMHIALEQYADIDHAGLRENLKYFLQ